MGVDGHATHKMLAGGWAGGNRRAACVGAIPTISCLPLRRSSIVFLVRTAPVCVCARSASLLLGRPCLTCPPSRCEAGRVYPSVRMSSLLEGLGATIFICNAPDAVVLLHGCGEKDTLKYIALLRTRNCSSRGNRDTLGEKTAPC
ncbi:hypothetical protein TPADAL_0126c [Treponema pallidum subsp. pallidum DAL-1]|uniref:Uncharacterized protein n=6 Tax=Treponema pallidum TaxID=160 RepID=E5FP51_TREPA|nr:hypothetical protein [Treponema pallidum subsp. pertenue]ADR64353.1 hypothetical protein [Treponema pallidum subsp. pertenue str. Gauthier]ADR64400.1 hypothetical protein [Treponema pallidum subsp. pallidum]ADR64438.1 hypothetical protein [Treponema pallidum str. Fribourg-Blanc]ADR64452.1 hypothetical protein [Treponema pallidum subsp. pallidum str. Nichols]AEZ57248.1 hypothetical protein TPESAMD_0126c [Treponema pallidum subsp. pertenue str. SamoaD]AEZ58317.1 hypothetical protein TPECDC2_